MARSVTEQQTEITKLFNAYRGSMTDDEALKRAIAEVAIKDLPAVPGHTLQDWVKEAKAALKKWGAYLGGLLALAITNWASYQAGTGQDITELPAFQFVILGVCAATILYISKGRKS